MARKVPRLSVNKLGEYLTSAASRRRRILGDAKYPKDFIVPRYNDFYTVAPRYLVSRPFDDSIVATAINEIVSRQAGTDWEAQNNGLNIDLLGNLTEIPARLKLNGLNVTALPSAQDDLSIAGVTVSVRPELLISGTYRGREVIGAIKFYLPKSNPLDSEMADYIGTLIHQYLVDFPPRAGAVEPQLCFVVDVPSKLVYSAPRAFRRRQTDIEAACDEIAARWASI